MAKKHPRILLALLGACCAALGVAVAVAQTPIEVRTWTDSQNRKIEAIYCGCQGDQVVLQLTTGQSVQYPLTKLSVEDQAYIRSRANAPAITPVSNSLLRLPIAQRTWPTIVEVPARAIEVELASESPQQRRFVYQSESFEFTSQAKIAGSVMKEVARTFEATRSLVRALPWGIACQPPPGMQRFQAALYETRADYLAGGGLERTGGIYSSGEKIFKIPFDSLGLEKRGQTYFKKDFTNETLVHEITHQMMDDYIGYLPMWILEGTAEYTSMLPYKAGVFRADGHKNSFKDYLDRASVPPDIDNLSGLFNITRSQWADATANPTRMAAMYVQSHMLIYYFCHLDGDKKGTRFINYMEAVYRDAAALRTFLSDPRVKKIGMGRITYPAELKDIAPTFPDETSVHKHLHILLGSRPMNLLANHIMEGFRSIGVRVSVR